MEGLKQIMSCYTVPEIWCQNIINFGVAKIESKIWSTIDQKCNWKKYERKTYMVENREVLSLFINLFCATSSLSNIQLHHMPCAAPYYFLRLLTFDKIIHQWNIVKTIHQWTEI